MLRKEEAQRHDEFLAILVNHAAAVMIRNDAVVRIRATVGIKKCGRCTIVQLRAHKRAPSLANKLKAIAVLVIAHELVNNVELLARELLERRGADREGHLIDHRVPNGVDPTNKITSTLSTTTSCFIEFHHKIQLVHEVRALRNHEIDRSAKVGRVLRINVLQLHLEARGARVTDVLKVGLRVVDEERILGISVQVALQHCVCTPAKGSEI